MHLEKKLLPFLLFSILFLITQAQASKKSVTIISDRDTTLIESPTGASGNGSGERLFVGRTNQGMNFRRRGLLHFDLEATVPYGSDITSASLQLMKISDSTTESLISVHTVLSAWGEGTSSGSGSGSPSTPGDATWVHTFFDTELWRTPGGDFISSPSTTQFISTTSGSILFPSTTSTLIDVQGWVDNPESNFGWLLKGNETFARSTQVFASHENLTTDSQPMLHLEFDGPDLLANPREVYFGEVEIDDEIATACVTVTNIGTGTITFTNDLILTSAPDFQILEGLTSGTTLTSGNSIKVVFSFNPDTEGVKVAFIYIEIDDSYSSYTAIHLTGTAVDNFQSGQIQLSENEIDFGMAVVGGIAVTRSLEIRNIGDQAINFTGSGIELIGPGDFSLLTILTTDTLAKDESILVNLEFVPLTGGLKGAQLIITTDDLNSPTVTLDLNGSGAEEITLNLSNSVEGYTGTSDTALYEFILADNGQTMEGDFSGNGAGQFLFTGETLSYGSRRSLIAFDLSGISTNTIITEVTLKLSNNRAKGFNQDQFLHRVLASWGEGTTDQDDPEGGGGQPPEAEDGEATWKYRFSPNFPWDQLGGDFVTTPSATTSALLPGQQIAFSSNQLLADVKSWVTGEEPNNGWMILGVERFTGTAVRYDSSDGLEQNRPSLEIKILQVPPATPLDKQQIILGNTIFITTKELQETDSNQDDVIDIGDILNEF